MSDQRLDLIASLLQTAGSSVATALKLLGEMRAEQVQAKVPEGNGLPAMAGHKHRRKE